MSHRHKDANHQTVDASVSLSQEIKTQEGDENEIKAASAELGEPEDRVSRNSSIWQHAWWDGEADRGRSEGRDYTDFCDRGETEATLRGEKSQMT